MQDYLYFLRLIEILHYLCHQNSKKRNYATINQIPLR